MPCGLKIFKIPDETNKYVTTVTTRDVIIIYLELGDNYIPLVPLYLKEPPGHLLVKGPNDFFFASFLFFFNFRTTFTSLVSFFSGQRLHFLY